MNRVPKLRFPEFSGEWEKVFLDNVTKRGTGHTPDKKKPEYYNGGIKWVSLRDSSQLDNGEIFETNTEISIKGIENSSAVIHPKGTVLLSRDAGVGKSAVMGCEMAVSQHFITWSMIGKMDNWFLYYYLQKEKEEFERIAVGSTIKTIGMPYFKNYQLFIPSLQEQENIGRILYSVDSKIKKLERKKELWEKYKKGMMQKIFSQKLRFKDENGGDYPEWEEKTLGEICSITTGKLDANAMVENGQYRFYTCAKDYYFIDTYAFDTDALLISGNGANVGYIHHYNGKFNAYQRTYVLDNFSNNIIFIKFILEKHLKSRIDREKNEGNTPYIVLGTLKDMNINLPSLPEQEKIADFLSSIDEKIETVVKELEGMKEFKKGLLQQMFV